MPLVAAVVPAPGRAMLPLPRGAAICQRALTMSPCRRRAVPARREPNTVPPARGTSVRPAVTRVRYFPGPKDGPNRSHVLGELNPRAPLPSTYPVAGSSIAGSTPENPLRHRDPGQFCLDAYRRLARPFPAPLVAHALARFPPDPNPFEAARLHPSLPACARRVRPPDGPGWLHEIKFDGYRVIARKDGAQVRLWARTTSDYSNARRAFCHCGSDIRTRKGVSDCRRKSFAASRRQAPIRRAD